MLRITPSTSPDGAKKYFTQSLTRDDTGYYHEGQELAGTWGGKAAQMLNLEGMVSQKDYFALCDNRNPETGERISPRNKEGRRVGFDFTFSAPKSVSVLYELTGDERILDAHRDSYRETMAEMEPEMKSRVRVKGADHDRETGNMVYAEFTHFTARPVTGKDDGISLPDPHLHTHVYAFNLTYDAEESRWKAGQFGDLKRDGQYWEAAFDNRLAHRLNALGYATEKRGLSFEIAGTPQSLIDKFSRRRNEIERKAAEKGISGTKAKHDIGYYGREKKNTGLTKAELRKEWDARLSDDERSALADAIRGRTKGDRIYTPDEAKEYALAHSFQRVSAVSEKKLKAEALKYSVGSVLPEDVADIAQHREAIPVRHDGQLFVTTKTVLDNEVAFLQFAKDGQRRFRPFVTISDLNVNKTGDFDALAGLSDEQRKTALHILGSRDQVVGVRGGPGTGKTHMLQTVNSVISGIENGSGDYSKVFAFAQSTTASRGELRKVGFRNAETLAMLFEKQDLQKQLHKQVILLDEAGLASGNDMRRLFDIAKEQQSRVILVGDYLQHSSVEASDAFRLIEKEAGVKYAVMKDIRRQTHPGYKKAVEAINTGTAKGAQKGFDALDKMGWVVEASGQKRHSHLVADYLRATDEGKSALIVTPVHAEGQKLTDELRSVLKERGVISAEQKAITWHSTGWTDAQKGDVRNYEPGLVVEFHQNVTGFTRGEKTVVVAGDNGRLLQKEDGRQAPIPVQAAKHFAVYRTREEMLGKGDRIRITKNGALMVDGQTVGMKVSNGDLYTIEGFTKEGDFRLPNGKVMPRKFGHFTMGYYDTSYKSQSKTVDRVFIAEGKESLSAANQQQWLVSATRGREMAKVYVDSKEDVRNAIARTGQRLSAVELTHTRLKDTWRKRFYQTLERNRVGRFLKTRANALADYWRERQKGISYA